MVLQCNIIVIGPGPNKNKNIAQTTSPDNYKADYAMLCHHGEAHHATPLLQTQLEPVNKIDITNYYIKKKKFA